MERRGCGGGCIIAWLGLVLSCCLLPYLMSSIYSLISAMFQVQPTSTWLWRGWLRTVVEADNPLYTILAEGPICCAGILALLIVVMGVVMVISSFGRGEQYYAEEEYESYPE